MMQSEKRRELESAVSNAFSPHSPINEAKLFAGRYEQIRAVVDTVRARGLHAIIYGERGVGKTSLANSIHDFLKDLIGISRVNCSASDDFDAVLRRALSQLQLALTLPGLGFNPQSATFVQSLTERLPADSAVSPDGAADLLSQLPGLLVLVIDEFDRLSREQASFFADFIKALSDRAASTSVVLVGVGQTIDNLISSHESVERCLRQIPLQKMSDSELGEIIDIGLAESQLTLAEPVIREQIVSASQGFPHFTHLLAQNAARAAIEDNNRTSVTTSDFYTGLTRAVDLSEHTYLESYRMAVTGSRNAIWSQVVLACALAETDEFGYFSGSAVVAQLSKILGQDVIQQTITYHLGKLIEAGHGPLLERTGPERRYRYRFHNPMMKPFVIIKNLSETTAAGQNELGI